MTAEILNFKDEQSQIKKAIYGSKLGIVFESLVATKDNFETVISRKPRVIHISCHGIAPDKPLKGAPPKLQAMSLQSMESDPELEGHYLLFENE